MQTIIDALAQMEQYLMDQAGISQEELENYLERLQNLIGLEESYKLELDEILSWIKAFQDN
jgi:DNA repair ATPase RecN